MLNLGSLTYSMFVKSGQLLRLYEDTITFCISVILMK